MGTFEAFYASPIQHPGLLWAAGLAGTAWALTRPGLPATTKRYVAALGGLTLLDAWLTTNDVPGLGPLPERLSGVVPLFFVLAGDLRYLLVVECGTPGGAMTFTRRGVLRALALMLVVPLSSQVLVPLLAGPDAPARVLYLVYELGFFALVLALMRWHPGSAEGRWARGVGRFVLLYYGLWATADAIILGLGADAGYALRVVPNLLYYGGLVAVIGQASSRDAARG